MCCFHSEEVSARLPPGYISAFSFSHPPSISLLCFTHFLTSSPLLFFFFFSLPTFPHIFLCLPLLLLLFFLFPTLRLFVSPPRPSLSLLYATTHRLDEFMMCVRLHLPRLHILIYFPFFSLFFTEMFYISQDLEIISCICIFSFSFLRQLCRPNRTEMC